MPKRTGRRARPARERRVDPGPAGRRHRSLRRAPGTVGARCRTIAADAASEQQELRVSADECALRLSHEKQAQHDPDGWLPFALCLVLTRRPRLLVGYAERQAERARLASAVLATRHRIGERMANYISMLRGSTGCRRARSS